MSDPTDECDICSEVDWLEEIQTRSNPLYVCRDCAKGQVPELLRTIAELRAALAASVPLADHEAALAAKDAEWEAAWTDAFDNDPPTKLRVELDATHAAYTRLRLEKSMADLLWNSERFKNRDLTAENQALTEALAASITRAELAAILDRIESMSPGDVQGSWWRAALDAARDAIKALT